MALIAFKSTVPGNWPRQSLLCLRLPGVIPVGWTEEVDLASVAGGGQAPRGQEELRPVGGPVGCRAQLRVGSAIQGAGQGLRAAARNRGGAVLRGLRLPHAQPRRRRPRYGSMTPSSDPSGVFGDGTDGLWLHRHGSIVQEAGLLDCLPKYAASPPTNKLTVSIWAWP